MTAKWRMILKRDHKDLDGADLFFFISNLPIPNKSN